MSLGVLTGFPDVYCTLGNPWQSHTTKDRRPTTRSKPMVEVSDAAHTLDMSLSVSFWHRIWPWQGSSCHLVSAQMEPMSMVVADSGSDQIFITLNSAWSHLNFLPSCVCDPHRFQHIFQCCDCPESVVTGGSGANKHQLSRGLWKKCAQLGEGFPLSLLLWLLATFVSLSPALKYLVLRGLWIFQRPSVFMIALVTSVPPLWTQDFPLLLYYVSFHMLLIQYMILNITHCFC